jgi:hypothetical protein
MTFKRSNVGNWTLNGSLYEPWDSYIGSNSSVGTIQDKYSFTFSNQTKKNFLLYFDSSTSGLHYVSIEINNTSIYGEFGGLRVTNTMNQLYIPSYSTFEIFSISTSSARYFDAWYLYDLGVSDSYNEGFDDGFLDGYDDALTDGGIFGIFTAVFSSMASILSIELFAEITLGTVLLFPLMFGILFFILRVIRGQ